MNKTSKNQKGFTLVEALLIILILVVIGAVGYMVYHNNHKTKIVAASTTSTKTSTKKASLATSSSTTSQATERSDNAARTADANVILAAISTFESNNESLFPSTSSQASGNSVYFCTASCNSSNSSTANLAFYKPQDILIEQSTSGYLSAPNDNTVYVTDNSSCLNSNTAMADRAGGDFAVIYALQNGNSTTQQCLSP